MDIKVEELYDYFLRHPGISTDTRNIEAGSLFFALKGAKFNGNLFAAQALQAGASYAVIDDPAYQIDERCLLVKDVLQSLQALARYHREQLNIPVIGITGTNGKTTTKELLHTVLSQGFKVHATKGNLNNHIGVPLTVLAIDRSIEIAIVEMGANHIGEIAFLCEIARPEYGLITNVGKAHLEGFGSFEGVKKAKGELYDWLAAHGGTLFLQQDNEQLVEMASVRAFKQVISYGPDDQYDVCGKVHTANPYLIIQWQAAKGKIRQQVGTQLTGRYNLENVLAAIAVGLTFGLSSEQINAGIAQYMPTNNRSQMKVTSNNTVICDYYNANASSMRAALENLGQLEAAHKAAVLGDMFELGEESANEHLQIIQLVVQMNLTYKIFIGEAFYAHREAFKDKASFYLSVEEAIQRLVESPLKETLILLKASRGMAFERILAYL